MVSNKFYMEDTMAGRGLAFRRSMKQKKARVTDSSLQEKIVYRSNLYAWEKGKHLAVRRQSKHKGRLYDT